jgi:hypothetical protein
MPNTGFLLVLMQPPMALEEEFNAWYDTEHVPERLALPGFEAARRYICVEGSPRYLAMYDLATPDAVHTREYQAVSGDHFSPWTRRVTSRVRVYRAAGAQVLPGQVLDPAAARVVLVRLRGLDEGARDTVIAAMKANFEARPEVRQVRVLANPTDAGIDYIGFVEACAPLDSRLNLSAFGACAEAIDLVSTYAPY